MTTIHEAYKLNQIIRNASAQRENKYMVARELWKAIAVPKIMSNDEVIGLKKKHLQQMEKTQNQIARFALGAPKYAAVESLRGEMGWSQFSERYEKGLLKIGGKIEMMEKNRYLSKIVKSREGYNGFGKEFQNAIDKTGNRELATRPLIGPSMWKKKVEEIIMEKGLRQWKEGCNRKSSLKYYSHKKKPAVEHLYDGSWRSQLLFRARAGCLRTRAKERHWNDRQEGNCTLCNDNKKENEFHIVMECPAYKDIRKKLLDKINESGFGEVEDREEIYKLVIGIPKAYDTIISETKNFLKEADIIRRNGMQGDVSL